MHKTVYLDNHTITRPSPSIIENMTQLYLEKWADLSSPHEGGQNTAFTFNEILSSLYRDLGLEEEDVLACVSSEREAAFQVVFSTYVDVVRQTGRNHFLAMQGENPSILHAVKQMEQLGCFGKLLPVNTKGQLTREILEEALRPRSALLSLSWANALTGVIQPVFDLAEVCEQKQVRLHIDASCVLGKLFFSFRDIKAEVISFDSSLIHAPKGGVGLIVKKGAFLSSLPSIEKEGDIARLSALQLAVHNAYSQLEHMSTDTARLRDKLEREIQKELSEVVVFFQDVDRLPHSSAMSFLGVSSEALLYALYRKGVYASIGGGRGQTLFSLLKGCDVPDSLAQSAISFSLSFDTTEEEIDYAIEAVVSCVNKLRKFSHALQEERIQ